MFENVMESEFDAALLKNAHNKKVLKKKKEKKDDKELEKDLMKEKERNWNKHNVTKLNQDGSSTLKLFNAFDTSSAFPSS